MAGAPLVIPLAGLRDVALTTNGVLLSEQRAKALRNTGLDRITVSLDAVDGAVAARMAGLRGGRIAGEGLVQQVLAGLVAARAAGFDPAAGALKLNAVIQRGVNDDQLIPLAELARSQQMELRLIEYMDVGNRNGWRMDQVLPAELMVQGTDLQLAERPSVLPQRRLVANEERHCKADPVPRAGRWR